MPNLEPVPHLLDHVVCTLDDECWMLAASADLQGIANGVFAEPTCFVELDAAAFGEDARFLGFSFAQFAMPVRGSTGSPFDWNPAGNVFSPPAIVPLVIDCPDEVILLAPLDSWHEQVFGVVQDENGVRSFRWGWHGDLDQVPNGFTTTLGIFRGTSASSAFAAWGDAIAERHPVERHADDALMTHLSYWTDNGAAYWYRREPGLDLATSLEQKLAELDHLGITIGAVELDSWFYEHEISRDVTELGELDEVPPTGMIEWSPRADVLPGGVDGLHRRLGERPLALHSRHISTHSPYVDDGWWTDLCAHPMDQGWFEGWFDDAQSWGATCVEQDWMLLYWFGVRQLREAPGRALAWQQALNDAAAQRNMALIFCMAMPGDVMAAATLDRVIALRTCDDYRYATDPARLWRWYLTMNRLAGSLGLPAFKDCFFTSREPGETGLDGDPHAEAESVLAAFSGGVVGIGDRLGHTDPAIVSRLLDETGAIATSDRPIALVDQCLFDDAQTERVTFAEAWSDTTRYVVALHLADTDDPVSGQLDLGAETLVYDWREKTMTASDRLDVSLGSRDWSLFVCCPIVDGEAVIGDPGRYATLGGAPPTSPLRWRADGL